MRTLFSHREFRLLFAGQAASTVGDRIVTVALALYVTEIGSPTDVGLVLAAHALPLVGFLLLGGVWADRLARHRVMLATDVVRALLHGLLAVLILTGAVRVWHIVVIEALFGTAEAFFRPALTGLVPQTVPDEDLQPAKALTGALETTAGFAGPALATVLVFGVGAGWAFAADAATFVVSAAFLGRMRPRARGAPAAREPLRVELREGWGAVRSRAWVWATIAAFSVSLLCSFAPWQTLGPTIAGAEHGNRAVFGLLATVQGVGTTVGAFAAFRWRPRHPMRAGLLATLAWPLGGGAFAAGAPVAALVPAYLVAGTGLSLFIIWWETALAQRIPPHLLSRVTSYDWMGSLALLPLGYLLAGPLGEALGSSHVLLAGCALALSAQVAALCVRESWTMRRLEPATG